MCCNSLDEQTILLSLFGNRALYLILSQYTKRHDMLNVPLDILEGSVSGQLKHTDRREWHISRRGKVAKTGQCVRTYNLVGSLGAIA